MQELQQLCVVPDGTPEQAQAMGLHYEIINAAQVAAESLLQLGRKLKQMRDTAGYQHLGFETFAEYTEAAVGIRQRQAYTYISLVEKVPARLIEENAAAGVTKLALLGTLAPADQETVARDTDLANITVAELKQLIAERQDLGEQLSLLQAEQPAAEAEEVDLDAIRAEAKEEVRAELEAELQKIREEAALDRKEQEDANAAAMKYKAEAERRAADQQRLEKLLNTQKESARREVEQAKKQAADTVQAATEKLEEIQRHSKEEAEAAAKAIAEAKMQADQDSLRFSMLFEQLQEKAHQLMALSDQMTRTGSGDKANKLRKALQGALRALADQAEGGGSDD